MQMLNDTENLHAKHCLVSTHFFSVHENNITQMFKWEQF